MLVNMHIKNLALIGEADIDFFEGLNVLTGETGAGKSIIIGSMNLALGEKIPKEMLKDNEAAALVELVFQVEHETTLRQLIDLGVSPEEGCVILSRKVNKGRSIAKINGETVTVSKMKSVAALLIDIHGQHEHESLLNTKKHLAILDEFARESLAEKKRRLAKAYREYKKACEQYDRMNMDEEARIRELSFLEYEMQEIEQACLQDGEDELLEEKYKRMKNSQKIISALSAVHEMINGGQDSVSEALGRSVRELAAAAEYDERIGSLSEQMAQMDSLMGDFSREMAEYMQDMDFSEEEYYETEKRLDEINHLKDKYGQTLEAIRASYEEREKQAELLRNYELEKQNAEKQKEECEAQVLKLCEDISKIRKKYSKQLAKRLKDSLLDLNFNDIQFEISFQKLAQPSANGFDEIEFLISTNPGEPLKSLSKVASGGELSRIMLAIKTVLAGKDEIETLIFDEIDSGISGRTAQKVSEKMRLISEDHQILCITHLPQIASMADAHYLIEKKVRKNVTNTEITPLSEEEMVTELARMLGGVTITDTVLQNASEMKALAKKIKMEK
ncbi:MAG: DNA repair protein RecN [Eubacterium sp.]|nr:DNA repair protein RecN [Eubacterium sp.]